jgi:hypothetical protein
MRLPSQRELDRTLEWACAHSGDWRVEDRRGDQLRATFARATETFAAATVLTREGYGFQAIMLARPLFEDLVIACWLKWAADPDWVIARLNDQHHHSRLIWNDITDRYPSLGPWELPDEATLHAERDRYQALFGPYGERSWWAVRSIEEISDPKTGKRRYRARGKNRNLKTLIDEVETEVAPESSELIVVSSGPPRTLIERLRYLFDVVYRTNNELLHHTARGFVLAYNQEDKAWREGPSDDLVPLARNSLLMTYDKLIFVMCQHGNPALESDYLDLLQRLDDEP